MNRIKKFWPDRAFIIIRNNAREPVIFPSTPAIHNTCKCKYPADTSDTAAKKLRIADPFLLCHLLTYTLCDLVKCEPQGIFRYLRESTCMYISMCCLSLVGKDLKGRDPLDLPFFQMFHQSNLSQVTALHSLLELYQLFRWEWPLGL